MLMVCTLIVLFATAKIKPDAISKAVGLAQI